MHIALSGQLGSGKSTICNYLKENFNIETFSTGTIHRKIAKEQGLSTLEFNQKLKDSIDIDAMIDKALVDYAKENAEKNIVFDSRMAWHFLPKSFKVFLLVSPKIAADRVFYNRVLDEENYQSRDAALQKLIERRDIETERFKSFYGCDCNNYHNYDLIVDTSELTVPEIAKIVLESYDKFNLKIPYEKYYLSPKNIFPSNFTPTCEKLEVIHSGNYLFIKNGFEKVIRSNKLREHLVLADKLYEASELDSPSLSLSQAEILEWEIQNNFSFDFLPNFLK